LPREAVTAPAKNSGAISKARRSTYEVMSCLEISERLDYCTKEDSERLGNEADEITAMITGFSHGL
jgi:four helix bundle protein